MAYDSRQDPASIVSPDLQRQRDAEAAALIPSGSDAEMGASAPFALSDPKRQGGAVAYTPPVPASNPFDQFDGATKNATNPFDQFDTPVAKANPFDQFDSGTHIEMKDGLPVRVAGTSKAPVDNSSFLDKAKGVGEAALQFGSSMASMPAAAIAGIGAQLFGGDADKTADTTLKDFTYQPRTAKGQDYSETAGDVMNNLIPAFPLMHTMPFQMPKIVRPVADDVASKLATIEPKAPEPLQNVNVPQQGDLFGDGGFNEQQYAESVARDKSPGQTDLFSNEGPDTVPKGNPPPEITGDSLTAQAQAAARDKILQMHQSELDTTPQGYHADQYGGGQDGLRIDENGMPIRADRSMEAQQLQDPLQRNLWGDELPRQSEQEAPRGITAAIDRMSGDNRAEGISQLTGIPKGQRGAIDLGPSDKPWFTGSPEPLEQTRSLEEQSGRANANKQFAGPGHYITQSRDLAGTYGGPNGRAYSVEAPFKRAFNLDAPGNKANYDMNLEHYGSKAEVNQILRNRGYDAITFKNNRGEQIANIFDKKNVTDIGPARDYSTSVAKTPAALQAALKAADGMSLAPKEPMRIPASQRGALNFGMFDKAKAEGLRPEEKVVLDALGKRDYIPKGDAPDDVIAAAKMEGKDGPSLWNNMQSGLQSAAEKTRSAAQAGVARWLSYGDKAGERFILQNVKPVERSLRSLSKDDLIAGQKILREENLNGRTYTPEELKSAGISDKAIAAHQQLRKAFDDALTVTNDSLTKLGKKPITKENAYMASMWDGNWHVPITDHAGKLAWYLKVDSKGEANRAIAWLKNNPEMSKTLDLDSAKPKYMPSNIGSKVPRDVMGAYQDMLKFFDGDVADHMKQAMDAYTQEQGFKFQQHNLHFKNKVGVRGYQGDRPWLSEGQNAMAQAKAQMNYLKDAYRWAPMQEALSNVKQILSDPELNKQQPNNMQLAKAYTANAMGLSNNLFKAAEQALQKTLSSMPIPKTFQNIGKFVGDLKMMTYLTQLGLSGGYMIATPLQAFLLSPSWHMKLSSEGFGHSALITSIKALADMGGLVGHPVTRLGQEAYNYMHDNGIITQNILHDNAGLGEHAPVRMLKQGIGITISLPEKVARAATFMSFVHHLDAAGEAGPTMFRRAEELTNHVLTDFRKISRPLAIDKFGQFGEAAYTYKSPLFNQYNNLSVFARDALKGKPQMLLGALGMSALLGGLTTMPFVNEADQAWNLVKAGVAHEWPNLYPSVSGLGIKGSIISHMNQVSANDKVQAALGKTGAQAVGDTGAYGAVSAATGSQMSSRFSSAIGDVSGGVLGNMAPVGQEIKEWVGAAHGLTNPNSTNITQGIYSAVAPPMVKGAMENNIDNFKTVKQENGQGYVNANNIKDGSTAYVRTPKEEAMRYGGLTSLQEATTKNERYINNQENQNFTHAQDASVDNMFDAIRRKDPEDIKKYAVSYFENNGDGDKFMSEIDKKIDAYAFTPEQRAVIKAQSVAAIKGVVRMRQLQGK